MARAVGSHQIGRQEVGLRGGALWALSKDFGYTGSPCLRRNVLKAPVNQDLGQAVSVTRVLRFECYRVTLRHGSQQPPMGRVV